MLMLIATPFFMCGLAAYIPILISFRRPEDWTWKEVQGALTFQFVAHALLFAGFLIVTGK